MSYIRLKSVLASCLHLFYAFIYFHSVHLCVFRKQFFSKLHFHLAKSLLPPFFITRIGVINTIQPYYKQFTSLGTQLIRISAIYLWLFCATNSNLVFSALFTRGQKIAFYWQYCIATVSFILQLTVIPRVHLLQV